MRAWIQASSAAGDAQGADEALPIRRVLSVVHVLLQCRQQRRLGDRRTALHLKVSGDSWCRTTKLQHLRCGARGTASDHARGLMV